MVEIENDKGIGGEIVDFGHALIHSALENPINGISQVINHAIGTEIPELQIVGDVKNPSVGAKLGSIAGGVIDYYVLSRVAGSTMGNLGGSGTLGSTLRGGIVGGVYSGLLTPTDAASDSFFKDRLTSGLVGAAGFAGMSAAGSYLAKTGMFAVPEVRSLTGSMTFGALSGAAGGVAQSEAEAIFKKGEILPSFGDLASNTLTMASFGAAFGALDFGYNKYVSPPKVTELKSTFTPEKGSIAEIYNSKDGESLTLKMFQNKSGEVVQLRAELPSLNDSNHIGWQATKMADGSWSNTAMFVENGRWVSPYNDIAVPELKAIRTMNDGTVKLDTTDGKTRVFSPDGKYERVDTNPVPKPVYDPTYSEYDHVDKSKMVHMQGTEANAKSSTYIELDTKGQVSEISFSQDGKYSHLTRQADGSWKMNATKNMSGQEVPSEYVWKGDVKGVRGPGGKVDSIEVTMPDGKTTTLPRSLQNIAEVSSAVQNTATFKQIEPSYRYLRTDADGNIFIKTGNATVNGNSVAATEVPIKAMDDVHVKFDVGDRYPEWVDKIVGWSSPNGKLQINGVELKPNSFFNLDALLGAK